VKTVDLSSQACTDVENAKEAMNRFSLAWHTECTEEYTGSSFYVSHKQVPMLFTPSLTSSAMYPHICRNLLALFGS